MRVIIIEDEILLAHDLRLTLMQIQPDLQVVAILNSVEEAFEYFSEEHQYDLIFSDIELGDGLSFEIFKNFELSVPVIFCTAYDEYALQAFNANGIDYILKPFSTESLKKALEKIDVFKKSLHSSLYKQYQSVNDALSVYQEKKSSTLMVRFRHQIIPVRFDDIALIYIENDVTYIITLRQKTYVIQQTLDEMENLGNDFFFRVNRQFLVNKDSISEVSQAAHRKLNIIFKIPFHREVIVSKEKVSKFLVWLNA